MTMGKKWVIWTAPAALLLIVFAVGFSVYRAARPSAEEQVRRVLEMQLRDPSSLLLRNVRKAANGGICGELNARNGFGGYTGFQRFYLVGDFVTIEGETTLAGAIDAECAVEPR